MESIRKIYENLKGEVLGTYFLLVEMRGVSVTLNKDPCWHCYHRKDSGSSTGTCLRIRVPEKACHSKCIGHSGSICMDCGLGSLDRCKVLRE